MTEAEIKHLVMDHLANTHMGQLSCEGCDASFWYSCGEVDGLLGLLDFLGWERPGWIDE